jgi:outer membrane murein-binding lipoprotein Lpp
LLAEPAAVISDVGQRRQAQLLAWVSLVLAGWFLLAAVSILAVGSAIQGAGVMFIVVIASGAAYGLSRTRHFRLAAWILVVLLVASGYSILAVVPFKDAGPTFLALVVIGFVIGSATLSVRGLSLAVVSNTLCWMVVAALLPDEQRSDFYAPAGSGTLTGILLAIFSGVRDLIERQRLDEITTANHELRAMQATLETRVAERTALAEAARLEAENARQSLENEIWLSNGQLAVNEALRGQQGVESLASNAMRAV